MKRMIAGLLILVLMLPMFPSFDLTARAESITDYSIKPHIMTNAWTGEEIVGKNEVTYKNVVVFRMGYNGTPTGHISEAYYALNGNYSSFSFTVGHSGNPWNRSATLTVIADGVTRGSAATINPGASTTSYHLDVSGVKQLNIRFESYGHDNAHYFIGDVKAVRTAEPEKPLVCNEFYDVVRSASLYGKVVTGEVQMSGRTYVNGYTIELGYGFNTGNTGNIVFDFNKGYKKMTFDIGRYEGGRGHVANDLRSAKMTIDADGTVIGGYDKHEIKWNDLAHSVELNLEGVDKLTITLDSPGVDRLYWFLGNIQLVSDGHAHGIILDKTSVTLNNKNPIYKPVVKVYPSDAKNKKFDLIIDKSSIAFFISDNGEAVVHGRHGGEATLTAIADDGGHTTTCQINSGFPAAGYLPSVHGWGFGNTEVDGTKDFYDNVFERICGDSAAYAMFDSGWKQVVNRIASAPQFLYYSIPRLMLGGGICHGMSLSSAYSYTKAIPFNTWRWNSNSLTRTNPADVDVFTESDGYSDNLEMYLAQMIVACHFTQLAWPSMEEERSTRNNFDALFKGVQGFQNGNGKPVLLRLEQYSAVHAVLPYEILEVGDEIRMYIYDPNAARENHSKLDTDNIYIVFHKDANGNVTNWTYNSATHPQNAIGSYSMADTDLVPLMNISVYADRIKNKQKYPFAENVIYISGPSSFEIKNGSVQLSSQDGKYTVAAGQQTLLPMVVAGSADRPSSGDRLIAAAPGKDMSISFGNAAGTAGLYLENNAFVVDCGANAQISKSADDRSLTVRPGADKHVTIRYNSGEDSVIVDGTVPEYATIVVDEEGEASLTGYSLVQVTTIRDGQTQTGKKTVIMPGETYPLSGNGDVEIEAEYSFIKPYAFMDCSRMVSYEIPESVNAIGEYAFLNCSGLKSMVIRPEVIHIGEGAFDGCNSLTLIVMRNSYAYYYAQAYNIPVIAVG